MVPSNRRGAAGPERHGGTRSTGDAHPPGGEVSLRAGFSQSAGIRNGLSAMVPDKTGVLLKGCLEVIEPVVFAPCGPA